MDRDREIEAVIDALERTWRRFPRLRLCQLIQWSTHSINNFYTSDEALLRSLIEYRLKGEEYDKE